MFDFLVVGAGLMGSAAGYHLARQAANVAIVGPAEPADWANHDGVFSSHYDQGRLASYYGSDTIWNRLDQAAIANYRTIEAASGIRFYEAVGMISLVPAGESRYAYKEGMTGIKKYHGADFPNDVPIVVPEGFAAYVEGPPSGYINPREMVQAQLEAARRHGATIVRQQVVSLAQESDHISLVTRSGQRLQSRKLLFATGAFANCGDLLPRPVALRIKPETTVLAQVPASEAERLANVPPFNLRYSDQAINDPYLAPPLLYPDGNYYLKMGCDTASDRLFTTFAEMQAWFQAGHTVAHLDAMQAMIRALFPELIVERWLTKPCIVCYTPSGKPYIDGFDDQVYLLTGGNGTGAHPAGALGQLAADLMLHDRWPEDLPREPFRLKFAEEWSDWQTAPLTNHFAG